MRAAASARAVRLGGVSIAPGEARTLALALPGRDGDAAARDAVPVSIVNGKQPGPRVTIVGAVRGFESIAARVAARVAADLAPDALTGSVIVVPVLRPGGRFAAGGRPLPRAAAWHFPGDAGGGARARDAFAVFSELFVGSAVAIVLTEPEPGWSSALVARGDLDDPRVRRLAMHLPVTAVAHAPRRPGSLAAAGSDVGTVVLGLALPHATGELPPDAHAVVLGALRAAGVLGGEPHRLTGARPMLFTRVEAIASPTGGLVEGPARAGDIAARGAALARVTSPFGEAGSPLVAPHACLVLEATVRGAARRGARLFTIGRVSAALARKAERPVATADPPQPLRVGWTERVSLPALGLFGLRAKIDTGARTSALHVARMKIVGAEAGPQHRPILEVTLPKGAGQGAQAPSVRIAVRDHVTVKDTSGRTERRPVIETTMRLGTLERRIRVTLTDRGDMLFPMLIGRTALGPGVVVDPSRRRLLGKGGRNG